MASNLPYSLILTRAGITGMGLYSCLKKLLGLLTMKIAGQDLLVNDGFAWEGGSCHQHFYFAPVRVENMTVWHVTIMSHKELLQLWHFMCLLHH